MNKVITINLAGRAFSVEEAGFEALNAYLKRAADALAEDPDKDEILADIESALAEKCAAYLSAHKNVVTLAEAETIVREMGPVAGGQEPPTGGSQTSPGSPKRLYRIREGSVIFGICNGLAAYFDVDVTLVRIIFVLLAVFTGGGFCFAYFAMMIFIPEATTASDRAAALGPIPTAQELINTIKRAYDTGAKEWKKWEAQSHEETHKWKHAVREERRRWKEERKRQWRHQHQQYAYRSPFWEFMQSVLGLVWFVLILAFGYWSYHHISIAHDMFNTFGLWLREAGTWISQKI